MYCIWPTKLHQGWLTTCVWGYCVIQWSVTMNLQLIAGGKFSFFMNNLNGSPVNECLIWSFRLSRTLKYGFIGRSRVTFHKCLMPVNTPEASWAGWQYPGRRRGYDWLHQGTAAEPSTPNQRQPRWHQFHAASPQRPACASSFRKSHSSVKKQESFIHSARLLLTCWPLSDTLLAHIHMTNSNNQKALWLEGRHFCSCNAEVLFGVAVFSSVTQIRKGRTANTYTKSELAYRPAVDDEDGLGCGVEPTLL